MLTKTINISVKNIASAISKEIETIDEVAKKSAQGGANLGARISGLDKNETLRALVTVKLTELSGKIEDEIGTLLESQK